MQVDASLELVKYHIRTIPSENREAHLSIFTRQPKPFTYVLVYIIFMK